MLVVMAHLITIRVMIRNQATTIQLVSMVILQGCKGITVVQAVLGVRAQELMVIQPIKMVIVQMGVFGTRQYVTTDLLQLTVEQIQTVISIIKLVQDLVATSNVNNIILHN